MGKFELTLNRKNISKEELLNDLKRVAHSTGKNTVTMVTYDQKGSFCSNAIRRRFGSWNTALETAGLKVVHTFNNPEEALFLNLADVWQRLGRQPVYRDLDKAVGRSKFSAKPYVKRFGSWNKALERFIAYINNPSADASKIYNGEKTRLKNSRSKRTPRNINWRLRVMVLIRDNCICKICGASPAKDSSVVLHVDHIKPWSKGGETCLENLQTLCSVCNIGKSNEIL